MNNICKNTCILSYYFILGIIICLYFISGLVFTIREFDIWQDCYNSNLGIFSIVSLIFFWITGSFKLFNLNQNNNNNKNKPLIIYIIFFIGNLVLFIWGYTDVFILSKKCEIYNKNLWIFNLISSSINLGIVLLYIFYLSNTINFIIKKVNIKSNKNNSCNKKNNSNKDNKEKLKITAI